MQEVPARLYGLDAMRGIAALCVLGLHVPAIYAGLPNPLGKAYLAVDFFFMLSGFLMARTYGARLASEQLSGWQFVRLRYRRLWPVMAVGGVLGAGYLWSATLGDPWLFAVLFLANMALLPVAYQQELFPLNVPAWSVLLELVVNALHGFLFARLSPRVLPLMGAAALIVTVIAASLAGSLDLGARPATLLAGLARAVMAYTIGMMLFCRWGDRAALAVPPLLAAVGFPLLLVLPWFLGLEHWIYDIGFVLIACPLLLAGGLALQRPSAIAVWLGHASFPLYAVHFAVLRQAQLLGVGPLGAVILALFATLLVTRWQMRPRRRRVPPSTPQRLAYADGANQGH